MSGRGKVRAGVLGAPKLQVITGGVASTENAVQPPSVQNGRGGRKRGGAATAPGPEQTCPLVALGHRAGEFFFLDMKGQERRLSARALGSRPDLAGMFVGDTSWLFKWFPRKQVTKKTNDAGQEVIEEKIVGFQVNTASEFLMGLCGDAGLYGPHVVIRGSGTWADEDGAPIVHAGDRVLRAAQWRRSGFRSGNQVWASLPSEPRPGANDADGEPLAPGAAGFAAPGGVARAIQDDIKTWWAFRHPGSEIVCLGLMGIGYYGAAARWRSNGYLIGGAGSGKSLLLELLCSCVPMHSYTTDTTKAGIQASINGKPMICFIDEAGDQVDQRGAQNLLELVLSASSNAGTVGVRGTADGKGRSFSVLCNVVMATVNPPEMGAAIRDRFTIVDMVKPGAGEDHRAEMEAAASRVKRAAPGLWARAIEGWPRWLVARDAFRAALGRAQCAAREMDQMGAILASWWVLTQDGVPDDRRALEGVHAVSEFVRGADEVRRDDGPRRLVQFLAGKLVQRDRSTDVEQIGVLIDQVFAIDAMDSAPARRLLERNGIRPILAAEIDDRQRRPVPRASDGDGIWFGVNVETLRALFQGSVFEGTKWTYEMLRHESAREWRRRNVRIGGVSGPAIWLSRRDWDPPDD